MDRVFLVVAGLAALALIVARSGWVSERAGNAMMIGAIVAVAAGIAAAIVATVVQMAG